MRRRSEKEKTPHTRYELNPAYNNKELTMGISQTSLDCLLNKCGSCHYYQVDCREFKINPGGRVWMKFEDYNGTCKLFGNPRPRIGAYSTCRCPGGKRMYKRWLELPSDD
jgi:hypothetical protein